MITLVQGDTSIGKTSLMIKLLADLSNGIYPPTMYQRRLMPPKHGDPVRSYYVTAENGMDDTIAPLFDPEEVLTYEFGLEPDYIFDLLIWDALEPLGEQTGKLIPHFGYLVNCLICHIVIY